MQDFFCMVVFMDASDIIVNQIAERIAPHLQECCVQAFVMCAYVADAEGNVSRISMGGNVNGVNPACEDGLLVVKRVGAAWAQGEL